MELYQFSIKNADKQCNLAIFSMNYHRTRYVIISPLKKIHTQTKSDCL